MTTPKSTLKSYGSTGTASTIRFNPRGGGTLDSRRTYISELRPQGDPNAQQQLLPVPTIRVEQIFLRHPRAIMILAGVQFCIAIQIVIFSMICRFYDGCRFLSGVWIGFLCIGTSVLGIALIKVWPKKRILYTYCALTILCCIFVLFLFVFLAILLDYEESWLRDSWDHTHQVFVRYLNRVIESTKIAMYTLQLLLACAYEICCIASLVLIVRNIWWATPSETVRAYYVQQSPMGHQTLLVPLDLTNAPPTAEEINLMQMADKISIGTQTAPLQEALTCL